VKLEAVSMGERVNGSPLAIGLDGRHVLDWPKPETVREEDTKDLVIVTGTT